MREETKRWHTETTDAHRKFMFNGVVDYHHIVSTKKFPKFKSETGQELKKVKGYFAEKDNIKYFLDEQTSKDLPIEIGKINIEMIYGNDDIIIRPIDYAPFGILPSNCFNKYDFINEYNCFKHQKKSSYKLVKIISIASLIGKTFVCIATEKGFNKSSLFMNLHNITNNCPVFRPETKKGMLNQITGDGNLVLDEMQKPDSKLRKIVEEVVLDIAGGMGNIINGALKHHSTKCNYDSSLQSITFLYNNLDHYKKEDYRYYFDVMFSNNTAMDDRFLKLSFMGKISEEFDRDFDKEEVCAENRAFYINIAKYIKYLKEKKIKNDYDLRYKDKYHFTEYIKNYKISERQIQTINDIIWCIDFFSETVNEYQLLMTELELAMIKYKQMTNFFYTEEWI